MTSFTRIKSILDFPLKNFPQCKGRHDDLYDLRSKCTRSEGFFLMKLDSGDYFESSFPLMLESTGAYMLCRIVASEAKHRPGAIYYDVYIHGGSMDASAFFTSPQELAEGLRTLEQRGMEYVFTENEVWGLCDETERPFDEIFCEFKTDIRFAIMFADDQSQIDDVQNKTLQRLEEYLND